MHEVETVKEHCKHPDCGYRCVFDYGTPYCGYALIEKRSRGCSISECDKYTTKKKRVTMTEDGIWFKWEMEDEHTVYR